MPKSSRSRPAAATSPRIAELLQRGLQLHQSGRAAEAAPLYEQVLALDPKQPAANHLLGVVRLAEGRVDDAIHLIARAVAADGKNVQYLGNLGVALNAAERHQGALEVLRRAVALKPDFAEAHTNMGTALRALGRFDEAAATHRTAVSLKPEQAGFHFNLGNALEDAGELHEAEASYREAIRLRPGHVGAMSGRSRALQALRRFDEASVQARSAAARAPDNIEALMTLARALYRSMELDEAVDTCRRVLERDPDNGEAYFYLAHLTRFAIRPGSFGEMERILSDETQSRNNRVRAGFGLGKGLADIGEHGQSLGVYRRANALRRLDVPFDTPGRIADMERVANAYLAYPGREGKVGYAGYAPLFIVGLPRAGKTTLEAILSTHVDLWGAGELVKLGRLAHEACARHGGGSVESGALPDAELHWIGESYADYVRMLAPAGRRTIDTLPPNFIRVGLIQMALPNARIVHCVRNPVEQCVAIFEKYFSDVAHGYSYDLRELASYYVAYRRLMQRWAERFPGAILDVDVSRLPEDPNLLKRLLDFCGLDDAADLPVVVESEPQLGATPYEVIQHRQREHVDAYRTELEPLLAAQEA